MVMLVSEFPVNSVEGLDQANELVFALMANPADVEVEAQVSADFIRNLTFQVFLP